ncbi:MAG: hypothetical protein ACQEQE_01615 [Bacillota bacterium]
MSNNNFEKNRQAILNQMKNSKKSRNLKNENLKNDNPMWKYEIEKYRKQKKKEKFFWIGSFLGIISFIMNIVLNFEKIKTFIFQWF